MNSILYVTVLVVFFTPEVLHENNAKTTLVILQAIPTDTDIIALIEKVNRKYGGRINLVAKRHNYDPKIIIAVIVVESSGENNALSPANAQGLMQLLEGTAKDMGISDTFHPYDNIWAGTKYLKYLQNRFGDQNTALAAYNLGPNRVENLLKNGFEPSSYGYVKKVREVLLYL